MMKILMWILLDMNFSAGINTGNEGLFWLSEIKKEDASIQVVLSRPMRTSTLPYGNQGRSGRFRGQALG